MNTALEKQPYEAAFRNYLLHQFARRRNCDTGNDCAEILFFYSIVESFFWLLPPGLLLVFLSELYEIGGQVEDLIVFYGEP